MRWAPNRYTPMTCRLPSTLDGTAQWSVVRWTSERWIAPDVDGRSTRSAGGCGPTSGGWLRSLAAVPAETATRTAHVAAVVAAAPPGTTATSGTARSTRMTKSSEPQEPPRRDPQAFGNPPAPRQIADGAVTTTASDRLRRSSKHGPLQDAPAWPGALTVGTHRRWRRGDEHPLSGLRTEADSLAALVDRWADSPVPPESERTADDVEEDYAGRQR